MPQIVAGVVLAQRIEAREHAAVRKHHLETEHQFPHHPVAEHLHPTGVGREVAADLATAFRAERQREEPPCRGGGLLCFGEHQAGLDDHRIVGGIDTPYGAHAPQ